MKKRGKSVFSLTFRVSLSSCPQRGDFSPCSFLRRGPTMCAKTIKSEPGSFCLLHGTRKKRGENKDSFCTGERTKNVFFFLFLLSLPPPHENAKGKRKEGRKEDAASGRAFLQPPPPLRTRYYSIRQTTFPSAVVS